MTLLRRVSTVTGALRELTKQTQIGLAAVGDEIGLAPVAVAVKDEPLRDVLRALALLSGRQWARKQSPNGQTLLVLQDADDPRRFDYLRPTTQRDADIHRGVHDFLNQAAQLPPATLQALGDEHKGLPFGDLPPGMQQTVRDALGLEVSKLSAMLAQAHILAEPTITPENADAARVTLVQRPTESGTDYVIYLSVNGSDESMATNIPYDPAFRDIGDTYHPSGADPYQYQMARAQALAARYDASRAKAAQDDPRLNQSVLVKSQDTSIGFPLAALAEAAHVNIVAQDLDETHTVSLGPVSLKDALDQIAAKYHAAWGVAVDGTILYHYREKKWGMTAQKTATK